MMKRHVLLLAALVLMATSMARAQDMPKGFGPDPALPEPQQNMLPTVNVADARGWPSGLKPVAAPGLAVNAFATGLDHPRWLYVLPDGDILVAETNAPPKPDDEQGIKGWFMGLFMEKAGAGTKSANRITLLRDADHDGVAEIRTAFLENLNSPFGMALIGDNFYVADTDAVLRFPYHDGETHIGEPGAKIAALPAGTINHHWTKNIVASPDGRYLYASIGSNSNAGENGLDKEDGRAAIEQIDLRTGKARIYAFGLRNPVGMGFQPDSQELWVSVNERDELGDDLVPDYMTSVRDGGFYGWPFSYYGPHIDARVKPQNPDLAARAIKPDYALGAHTASLGLTFYNGTLFPQAYRGGAFVGQHGSWNRSKPAGYKVIFVPFTGGHPSGPPANILTEFLNADAGMAYGRPVGVAVDKTGALLVADDVGNAVWRVVPAH
jgi:glucose/arabinose dehydrogenase